MSKRAVAHVNTLINQPTSPFFSSEGKIIGLCPEMCSLNALIAIFWDCSRQIQPVGARLMIGDRFYIALFSALLQTHCAFVACDPK